MLCLDPAFRTRVRSAGDKSDSHESRTRASNLEVKVRRKQMTRYRKQRFLGILVLAASAISAWAQGGHLSAAQDQSVTEISYISTDMHLHLLSYLNTPGAATVDRDLGPSGTSVGTGSISTVFTKTPGPVVFVGTITRYITADQHVQGRSANQSPDAIDPPGTLEIGGLDDTATIGGTPKAFLNSSLTQVVDNINGDPQGYYIAQDGNVHMLGQPGGGSGVIVRDLDLQSLAGGPNPAVGTAISGAADTGNNLVAVFYIDTMQHVQKLAYDNTLTFWNEDPTALTGAPLAAVGSPLTSLQVATNTVTAYLTADGHIHGLFFSSLGGWSSGDITAIAGAVPVINNGSLASLLRGATPEIFYIGNNQHVYMLSNARGKWTPTDITLISGSNPAAGSSLATTLDATGTTTTVVYVATDQHVHSISSSKAGSWMDADLTKQAGGPNAIP
jgi:hypothetical protein